MEEKEQRERDEQARRELVRRKELALREQCELDAEKFLSDSNLTSNCKVFSSINEAYDFGHMYIRVLVPAEQLDNDAERTPGKIVVASTLALEDPDIILHWGVKKGRQSGWIAP